MNRFVRMMLSRVGGMYEGWLKKRSEGFLLPEEVEEFRDIPYMDDGLAAHRMDIFRPKEAEGRLPVIVNLHGGGLVLCTKDVNRPFCVELAKRGYLVFCVDYPLVPEVTVPQMLRDVCAAMDRAAELLESFGGDPNRVYLVGDSAGAFLSVYAVAVQKDEKIASAAGVKPSGLKVQGLGLISGMFHTAECDETGFFLRKDFYGKGWRRHPLLPYLKPERKEVASLMSPVFLVTSKADKLRTSTIRFYRGLTESGIRCRLLDLPAGKELGHDFVIMYPERDAARGVIDELCAFLTGKNDH